MCSVSHRGPLYNEKDRRAYFRSFDCNSTLASPHEAHLSERKLASVNLAPSKRTLTFPRVKQAAGLTKLLPRLRLSLLHLISFLCFTRCCKPPSSIIVSVDGYAFHAYCEAT